MIDPLLEKLARELEELTGKECWSMYGGPSTGSAIDLDFGRRVPRRVPILGNPNLTEAQKFYSGELSLYVECAWRLDTESEVVCGSTDSNTNDGPMLTGLQLIVGRQVECIALLAPAADLVVTFREGFSLRIFCDQTNAEDDEVNYSFHAKEKIYVVGPRGRISVETPSGEVPRW